MLSGKRAFDAPVGYERRERYGGVGGDAETPVGEGQADAQAVHQRGGPALEVGADGGGQHGAVILDAQQYGLEYGVGERGGQQHDAVGSYRDRRGGVLAAPEPRRRAARTAQQAGRAGPRAQAVRSV